MKVMNLLDGVYGFCLLIGITIRQSSPPALCRKP
jgi:hypothetical protein